MRSSVLRNRKSVLLRVSSIAALGVLVAGCSSGFERFDHFYNSATEGQSVASNPYPAGVDPQTTASTGSRLAPLRDVAPKAVPQGVYHQPEPTYVQPQPTYQQPTQPYQPEAYQPYAQAPKPTRQALDSYKPTVTSTPLKPVVPSAPKIAYVAPKPTVVAPKIEPQPVYVPKVDPQPVYIAPKPEYTAPKPLQQAAKVYTEPKQVDPVTTAAIDTPQVQPVATQPTRDNGWTSTGGTTIVARSGETLYNLSKRYGVPVSEIRRANGMNSVEGLKSGQQVLIPNYVFSPTAPVSAPDNNPDTRAARASTGYVGEANPLSVAIPTHRPAYSYQTAAVSATGDATEASQKRYKPKTHVEPTIEQNTPDYGIVTGSAQNIGNSYTVQSGDSLSKIASKYGTNVSALQAANGISGSSIRVGQKLVIPGSGVTPVTNSVIAEVKEKLPANVDPITTSSVKPEPKSEPAAPARSGISDFRWPVQGRVVAGFGDKVGSNKNEGIDISVPEGTAVKAAENGVVIYAGEEISSYGKLILVRHTDGWVSAYAHNRDFEVKKGDNVRRGQIIARSGRTGGADRPKLHFELRKNSVPVNPTDHLSS